MTDPSAAELPPTIQARPVGPTLGDPESTAERVSPARRAAGRASVYVAAMLVVLVGGTGLFVSGFMLGRESTLAPGTGDARQALFKPFWDAYNDISANYVGDKDDHTLVQGAIKGLFDALGDPFSSYMTEEEYRASLISISGQFEGIGAEMTTQDAAGASCAPISDACRLTVVNVLRDSPALRAGLTVGDAILSVDGTSTVGQTLESVIPTIRGPKGSAVVLGLERGGQTLELSITRDVIATEDVTSEVVADGRIGYVKVENFSARAADDLAAQLRELVGTAGVRALILDLRDDPGGYVDAARKVASQFVATSPLYWEQNAGSDPVAQPPIAGGAATDPAVPLAVLVNGGTASASEIVAAALQGSGRAQLVGQTTYGKGTIQEWKELPGAGGYRLSVRKWLAPDKTWIHGKGLTPDVVVEVPADTPAGSDPVLDRAIELLTAATGALPARPIAA